MLGIMNHKPFETYHYYKGLHHEVCTECENESSHYLLRYRTYFSISYPIIRTSNTYYMVCPSCYSYKTVEDEFMLMKLLQKSKGQKPQKYNKFSILDLETNNSSAEISYSVKEVFEYNVIHHIKHMKK